MTSFQNAKFVIFGATSAIASATARLLAQQGARLVLVGRDRERTEAVACDIRTRTDTFVDFLSADLNDTAAHPQLLAAAMEKLGGLDGVLLAHGILGDQEECSRDFAAAALVLQTNLVSTISLLTVAANILEKQKHGQIAVIGSVAGDRGRQSNYVYGASKGGLEIFVQGLRNRLTPSGVGVLLVKPGFVDTPMTQHLKKNPLFAQPETIAAGIVAAMRRRKDTVYLPWFWSLVMFMVRNVPERVFKRMKL